MSNEAGKMQLQWWQKPGLAIMYQIEYRPGWNWERDYEKFNKSMMDDGGNLAFNGPFCRIDDWVRLSKQTAVDYHILEIKWHDGICYFNTKLTDWKTELDYAARFAHLSREAAIPFMYYYSSIFDHNPQFDSIQPNTHSTVSFLSQQPQPIYEDYLRGHYREIMDQYDPDGMWIDWYWNDTATSLTIDLFKNDHPDTVLTFNASNYNSDAFDKLHFTSGEAHKLDGELVRRIRLAGFEVPVFESAWKWSNNNRQSFDHPWELVGPAGKEWQDPTLRDDPVDMIRIVAVALASGGKYGIGATAQLDGRIFPDQEKQLEILGEWYGSRKGLFTEATPLKYEGDRAPGVEVDNERHYTIGSRLGDDTLVHIINMDGLDDDLTVTIDDDVNAGLKSVYLEPAHTQLRTEKSENSARLVIDRNDVDIADTILRLKFR